MQAQAIRHTCGGPSFGRLTPGCPRCDELASGAAPRSWGGRTYRKCSGCGRPVESGYFGDRCQRCQSRAHYTSARHLAGGGGPVSPDGEW